MRGGGDRVAFFDVTFSSTCMNGILLLFSSVDIARVPAFAVL